MMDSGPGILLVLVLIIGASTAVYTMLERRWTIGRHGAALRQWAGEQGFRMRRRRGGVLPQLVEMGQDLGRPIAQLTRQETVLVQLELPDGSRRHWLIRPLAGDWPTTGLWPAHRPGDWATKFGLRPYPDQSLGQRLVLLGQAVAAAKILDRSNVAMLMPPDVGLLLHGRQMVLDFSSRPFDGIEFLRILGLAEQLAKHLPEWPGDGVR